MLLPRLIRQRAAVGQVSHSMGIARRSDSLAVEQTFEGAGISVKVKRSYSPGKTSYVRLAASIDKQDSAKDFCLLMLGALGLLPEVREYCSERSGRMRLP